MGGFIVDEQLPPPEVPVPPVAGPAPGWYPDPEHPSMQRWWNGTEWATARRDPGQAAKSNKRGLLVAAALVAVVVWAGVSAQSDREEAELREAFDEISAEMGGSAGSATPSKAGPHGDGFYTVGVEIDTGTWRSDGSGDSCYWARLDQNQDLIDNHFGDAGGSVTIVAGDYEVQFQDSGTWTKVG